MFILNKKSQSRDIFVLFSLALLVRLTFIFFHNPNINELIEDELLYWYSSIDYINKGVIEESILTERMHGIFLYTKILLLLSYKNIKIYLIIQSIIDAFTCVIIYKTGALIFPKQKIYIYLSAIFSPLMIILSSQVLSETIFLFLFTIFLYFSTTIIVEKNQLYLRLLIAGLFLGLSTSIRSITYPLVFLSLLPIAVILLKKNIPKYKILISGIIFIFFSLLPISTRILENIKLYDSFSLTTQTGTHIAYWVVPSILTHTEKISRSEAIEIVNKLAEKYNISENYFEKDRLLQKVGLEVLSNVNKSDIVYNWVRGGLINLLAPSILLDKNFRRLPHPSYYEAGNISLWLKLIYENTEYHKYLFVLFIASISSMFTLVSLIIGLAHVYRKNTILFYITILYISYFLIITGPVLSPKYIFPILPCIFLFQGVTFFKIINLFKSKQIEI